MTVAIGPEAERAALFAEGERDARETAARVAALEAAAGKGEAAATAAETRAAELRVKVTGPGQSARREREAFERRQREREWDLRRLAAPELEALAVALEGADADARAGRIAGGSLPGGELALLFRQSVRRLREEVQILPASEATAALAAIRAGVAAAVAGVPEYQLRRLLPHLTDNNPEDL